MTIFQPVSQFEFLDQKWTIDTLCGSISKEGHLKVNEDCKSFL